MSTPVYFYAATDDQVMAIGRADALHYKPTVRSKNISPQIIGDLDFAITGERDREPVAIRDDSVAVFRLDDALVQALAQLGGGRDEAIADDWGVYDAELVGTLRRLAKRALSRGEGVYLCFEGWI